MATFGDLPPNADLVTIIDTAGKMFDEQVRQDKRTNYGNEKAFNDAIWFLAEKAQRRGFSALRSMSTSEIASMIVRRMDAYLEWKKRMGY